MPNLQISPLEILIKIEIMSEFIENILRVIVNHAHLRDNVVIKS